MLLGRVVEPGERVWLDDDVAVLLGWQEHLDSLCSGCQKPRHESFDPENAGAYVAESLQCHACAARDAEHRKAAKARERGEYSDSAFDGLFTMVTEQE